MPLVEQLAARIARAELELRRGGIPPRVAQAAVRRAVKTASRHAAVLASVQQVPAALSFLEGELAGARRWCDGVLRPRE